jgi:prolyl 4-hydroxylase
METVLARRAGAGDGEAQIALAQFYESAGRHDLARGWYARAAKVGDLAALRQLALNLLTQEPIAMRDGMGMLREAAARGDADALHHCAVVAAQDTQLESNWEVARDYLVRAAERGSELARAQIALLSGTDAAGRIAFADWLEPAPTRRAFEAPRISVAQGFASAAECDWLIARGRGRLVPAEVYDPQGRGGLRAQDIRNNSAAGFDIAQSDVVLALLRARIARATGLSTDVMEPAMLLHYATGEQFAPHFDFIDPDVPDLAGELARRGQRVATFLLYLDDGHEGGETEFIDLGWRHRGAKGDALIFWNVAPDGRPDRRTRHAGLAPTRGEKWLLSQWIRAR